jgi:SAM-dependent methyltransferase
MRLLDVVRRDPKPEPWSEGEKIPWDEPGFSARMLREHLSQAHDAASRRFETIDRQVAWIHEHVLAGRTTRILDLGCGPGLYASRMARRGHTCVGIDFSPASVAYAREQAQAEGLDCSYVHADVREADYGTGYGLVMFVFGEFNVFRPADARHILRKAHAALAPGGVLLLEPHTFEAVEAAGRAPATWYSSPQGLFSERPHLVLMENVWDAERQITTQRYFVIDAERGTVTRHAASMQAYTDADYAALLAACGFSAVTLYPSLIGTVDESQSGLLAVTGQVAE